MVRWEVFHDRGKGSWGVRIRRQACEHRFDLRFENRHVITSSFVYAPPVDAVIGVNQDVAHIDNSTPWNLRIGVSKRLGHAGGRLAMIDRCRRTWDCLSLSASKSDCVAGVVSITSAIESRMS